MLLGVGDGTFGAVHSFPLTTYFYANAISSGDFNGDGKRDLVVNNGTGISVILGNGDGTFLPEHDFISSGGATGSLSTADFNADGISDVAATHDSAVSIFFGKSDGTMLAAATFPIGIAPGSVQAGDFNRDGKPDVLTGDVYNVGPSVMLSTLPDACFACTNPTVPEGASCTDGNVCTTGDTCRSHVCTGSDLTDGASCSTRANASGLCSVGACEDTCNPGFADCGGVCTGIVSDNQNCGGCGITCAAGQSCAAGRCVLTEILRSCSSSSPVTVLVKGAEVTAYVANGHWDAGFLPTHVGGVQAIPLEGGGTPSAIGTRAAVDNCAANAVTGEIVCVGINNDVYTIEQGTLTSTL